MLDKISLSDENLMIALCAENDIEAFEILVSRYEKQLPGYIYRYVGDYQMVKDIFQETFYRIYQNRKDFNSDLPFSPWVYRIVTNLCISTLNKKSMSEETMENHRLDQHVSPSLPTLEEKLITKSLAEHVKDIVLSLPEKIKTVFILAYYQEIPPKEIAIMLDIPLGTVKSRLHNGFKQVSASAKKRGLFDEMQ
jgi:RNA polymerase sigma-70 factor (ECF subfamily)